MTIILLDTKGPSSESDTSLAMAYPGLQPTGKFADNSAFLYD